MLLDRFTCFIILNLICIVPVSCGNDEEDNGPTVNSPMIGTWAIVDSNFDFNSGPFATLVAGAASRWGVSLGIGSLNSWGSKLTYNFFSNGS